MKLTFSVYPYAEFRPEGLKLSIVQEEDYQEVNTTIDIDTIYENICYSDMDDQQMADTANVLETLAKDIREHILKR